MTMLDKKKAKNKYVDENGVEWTKARCFFCQVHCSIYGGVKDGKVVAVEPLDEQSAHCHRMGRAWRRSSSGSTTTRSA